jgi:hypothetical protein
MSDNVASERTVTMSIDNLIAQIDAKIIRLEQARALLSGVVAPVAKKKGRSAGVVKPTGKPAKKKRNISPEGRARIGAAVKARWAAQE